MTDGLPQYTEVESALIALARPFVAEMMCNGVDVDTAVVRSYRRAAKELVSSGRSSSDVAPALEHMLERLGVFPEGKTFPLSAALHAQMMQSYESDLSAEP